jgi:hypothetical protein
LKKGEIRGHFFERKGRKKENTKENQKIQRKLNPACFVEVNLIWFKFYLSFYYFFLHFLSSARFAKPLRLLRSKIPRFYNLSQVAL